MVVARYNTYTLPKQQCFWNDATVTQRHLVAHTNDTRMIYLRTQRKHKIDELGNHLHIVPVIDRGRTNATLLVLHARYICTAHAGIARIEWMTTATRQLLTTHVLRAASLSLSLPPSPPPPILLQEPQHPAKQFQCMINSNIRYVHP